MKIVISNDDGYHAPGINVLAEALEQIADVIVVAPDRNRSGASNSLTLDAPLRLRKVRENFYYVNGTPTDCVHLAVTGLLDEVPDMVVAGINEGPNLGDDVLYSGTAAAAMEGRFLGLPAIAISLDRDAEHYETAAEVAKNLVLYVKKSELPAKTILNVNVPDIPLSKLGAYELTRLGTRHLARPSIKQTDPRGNEVYWIGLPGSEQDAGPGTDFYALKNNHVSITPLRLESTNFQVFAQIAPWLEELNAMAKKSHQKRQKK